MNSEDFYPNGKRWWLRLHETGGRIQKIPAHPKAEDDLDANTQVLALSLERKTPLFRTVDRQGNLTDRRISRREVLAMMKRRAVGVLD